MEYRLLPLAMKVFLYSMISLLWYALSAKGNLSFTVVGDWGGKPDSPYTTPSECSVSNQMGQRAQMVGSQFTVALGDNFYYDGVTDVHDPRFKETFEASPQGGLPLFKFGLATGD